MTRLRARVRAGGGAIVLTMLAACGSGAGAREHRIDVFAASSLTDVMPALERAFRTTPAGRDVDVRPTFGGSASLAEQVRQGAPADVVVTADAQTMQRLVDAEEVGEPVLVARNRLALAVPRGNPAGVAGLGDLARPGVVFVTCAPSVPCGRLAREALQRAGVDATPSSLEENVRAVLAKVALGEADAGIVYETDVRTAGRGVEQVVLAGEAIDGLAAEYYAAVVDSASGRGDAERFTAFLRSPDAKAILSSAGFVAS